MVETRIRNLEQAVQKMMFQAPTVPNYDLVGTPIGPPPLPPNVLKCDCSGGDAYVSTWDVRTNATGTPGGPGTGPWLPVPVNVISADIYIPSSTYAVLDANPGSGWTNGSSTASLFHIGQAGGGFFLADTADGSAGGPGLMSQQYLHPLGVGGGGGELGAITAYTPQLVSMAPDTWHTVIWIIGPSGIKLSDGYTYYDVVPQSWNIDFGANYGSCWGLWGVRFSDHEYAWARIGGYQSSGLDGEVYYFDNFGTKSYCTTFDAPSPGSFAALQSPNGSVVGNATDIADPSSRGYGGSHMGCGLYPLGQLRADHWRITFYFDGVMIQDWLDCYSVSEPDNGFVWPDVWTDPSGPVKQLYTSGGVSPPEWWTVPVSYFQGPEFVGGSNYFQSYRNCYWDGALLQTFQGTAFGSIAPFVAPFGDIGIRSYPPGGTALRGDFSGSGTAWLNNDPTYYRGTVGTKYTTQWDVSSYQIGLANMSMTGGAIPTNGTDKTWNPWQGELANPVNNTLMIQLPVTDVGGTGGGGASGWGLRCDWLFANPANVRNGPAYTTTMSHLDTAFHTIKVEFTNKGHNYVDLVAGQSIPYAPPMMGLNG